MPDTRFATLFTFARVGHPLRYSVILTSWKGCLRHPFGCRRGCTSLVLLGFQQGPTGTLRVPISDTATVTTDDNIEDINDDVDNVDVVVDVCTGLGHPPFFGPWPNRN